MISNLRFSLGRDFWIFVRKNIWRPIWLFNFTLFFIESPERAQTLIKEWNVIQSLQIVSDRGFKVSPAKIIVIVIVRNDLARMRAFLKHYRSLGITQFAILDDVSTDGTKEFLLAQKDVEVFVSSQRFTLFRQIIWYNLFIQYYGNNRWYLTVDSDELFIYENFEQRNIYDVLAYLEEKNLTGAQTLMLDMYSNAEQAPKINSKNIYANINYFDKAGYMLTYNYPRHFYWNITGGARTRLLGIFPWISKQSLFFAKNYSIVADCHYLFPLRLKSLLYGCAVLLHYKFLPEDAIRYKDRLCIDQGKDTNRENPIYLDCIEKNLSFYKANISAKYENSYSLIEHGLLRSIWKD